MECRGRSTRAVGAVVWLALVGGCGAASRSRAADACGDGAPTLSTGSISHALKTVFVIVMENRDWSSVAGSPSAPYINGTLLPRFAHAERYRNGGLHPSLAVYTALEAGDPLGIDSDATPASVHLPVTCHLVTWLEAVGLAWKAYQEGIDGTRCPIADAYPYTAHHDPFVYFDDVAGNPPSPSAPRCIAHVRPYPELARDLEAGTVARYNFITPDVCDDGHDSCPPDHDAVRQTDDWLARELPRIMSSAAYRYGGAILIVWDEPETDDAPVGLIVVSPLARPGYASTTPYSPPSLLRTVEEVLGLTPLLRQAATATSLSDLFTTYP